MLESALPNLVPRTTTPSAWVFLALGHPGLAPTNFSRTFHCASLLGSRLPAAVSHTGPPLVLLLHFPNTVLPSRRPSGCWGSCPARSLSPQNPGFEAAPPKRSRPRGHRPSFNSSQLPEASAQAGHSTSSPTAGELALQRRSPHPLRPQARRGNPKLTFTRHNGRTLSSGYRINYYVITH